VEHLQQEVLQRKDKEKLLEKELNQEKAKSRTNDRTISDFTSKIHEFV